MCQVLFFNAFLSLWNGDSCCPFTIDEAGVEWRCWLPQEHSIREWSIFAQNYFCLMLELHSGDLTYFLSGILWPDAKQEHCFQAGSADADFPARTMHHHLLSEDLSVLERGHLQSLPEPAGFVAESCSCRDGGATNPAVISLGLWAGGIKHQQEEHTSVFHRESSCSQTHLSLWCVYSFGWYWFLILSMFEGKIWDFILIICDTNLHCKWKSLINRLGD